MPTRRADVTRAARPAPVVLAVALALSGAGCAWFARRQAKVLAQPFGTDLIRLAPDAQKLGLAVQAFGQTHRRWPASYDELQAFARGQGFNLELREVERIELKPLPDEGLLVECTYQMALMGESAKRVPAHIRLVIRRDPPDSWGSFSTELAPNS